MRVIRSMMLGILAVAVLLSVAMAQAPAGGQQRGGGGAAGGQQRGAADARGGDARGGAAAQRGGRGGGAAIASLAVTSTAWPDGGLIPLRYTQVGGETSPGVQWSGAPQGIMSYVITFHDADTVVATEQFFDLCLAGIHRRRLWNITRHPTESEMRANVANAVNTFMRAFGA